MYLQSQHFTGNATRVPEAQTLLLMLHFHHSRFLASLQNPNQQSYDYKPVYRYSSRATFTNLISHCIM